MILARVYVNDCIGVTAITFTADSKNAADKIRKAIFNKFLNI